MQQPARAGRGRILLIMCILSGPVFAQDAPPPPPPTLGKPVPLPPLSQPTPLTYAPPPPGPIVGPVIGPSLDPGADGWGPYGSCSTPPGFFFSTEVAFVFPAVKFRVTNDVPLPNTGLTLNVPSTELDWTVMPTFEIGYNLGDSAGLFALSYSFLLTEGKGQATNNLGTFDVRTRAQVNWADLDYGTSPYEFAPRWEVSYRIGARIVDVYFDSTATNPALTQSASNDFFGAGPHARMDIERRIVPIPGLSLFGRLDGAALVGRVKQNYQVALGGVTDSASARVGQTVPYINLQAGLSYAPPSLPGLKLTVGYLFEDYFNVGRLGVDNSGIVSNSRGELWWHGAFVRGQFDF